MKLARGKIVLLFESCSVYKSRTDLLEMTGQAASMHEQKKILFMQRAKS